MSHHIGLQVLRAKIRGFQAAGSTIASRITKSQKERKSRLWDAKRRLGLHCRHHLIAYGLLRGIPYDQIERCAPNNKPNARTVLDIVVAHNQWTPERGLVKYDLPAIEALLASSVTGNGQESPTVAPAPAASTSSSSVASSVSSRLLRALRLPLGKGA